MKNEKKQRELLPPFIFSPFKIFPALFFFYALSAFSFSFAQTPPRPLTFAELWNNAAYYETNLERKNFSSLLGRFEGKLGVNLFNLPLQLYGAYYGMASQSEDYWDNSLFYGVGIRFYPFENFQGTSWANEWIRALKVFAEKLTSSYLKGAASAEASNLWKTDTRYGLDLWYEWNLDHPDENLPWGELWANLSYRTTNFGWEPEGFKSYVIYFQPKIGRHLGKGVEVYLRSDLVASGKSGPDYYFLNNLDYGVGIRFEPWRESHSSDSILKKFKMFAEVLGVSYLKDKPSDANKIVSSDVRFGIDFSYGR